MKMNEVLSQLLDDGYGKPISKKLEGLGDGICSIEYDKKEICIFENGFTHSVNGNATKINYDEIVGIKSGMTIEKLSSAQNGKIDSLIMRFECKDRVCDLLFPLVIYSSLISYICDQVNQLQENDVSTGFIT